MHQQPVPSFFVLGAAKCGTTWLHAALEAHPQIDMTAPKECNVLSRVVDEDGMGEPFGHMPQPGPGERRIPRNWRELYGSHLGHHQPGHAIGDGSLTYTHGNVLRFIRDNIPDAKFIYVMRNPVERLKSERLHKLRTGEVFLDVDSAISSFEKNNGDGGVLINPGMYSRAVERIFSVFPRERVLLLVMERMLASEAASVDALRSIFEFLGVDAEGPVALPGPANTALVPRSFLIARQIRRIERSTVARRVLHQLHLRAPAVRRFLWRIKSSNLTPPTADDKKLTPEQKARLAEIFRADVEKLKSITGLDFPEWSRSLQPALQPHER